MNKLPLPTFNDQAALVTLSQNPRAGSYPSLQPYVVAISAGYAQYTAANGDATAITAVPLPQDIETYLRGHYAKPPSTIAYISEMRRKGRPNTCPMCGSMYGPTLDHLLPKEDFAAFAIFGPNLVPACSCNILRGQTLIGPGVGERVLHPYFDQVLSQRLVEARFEDLGPVPRVSLQLVLHLTHPDYAAAKFHLIKVVAPTQAMDWIGRQWTELVLKPGNVIRDLRQNPTTPAALTAILQEERDRMDEARRSRNNWDSVFIAGLLDPPTLNWLFAALNHPGRAPDSALV
jgi:hypothetical protein